MEAFIVNQSLSFPTAPLMEGTAASLSCSMFFLLFFFVLADYSSCPDGVRADWKGLEEADDQVASFVRWETISNLLVGGGWNIMSP